MYYQTVFPSDKQTASNSEIFQLDVNLSSCLIFL